MSAEGVTVCITRTVKPEHEAAFERALHEFVERSLVLPGQHGVHIMRPAPGSGSHEYGIVRKFADRAAVAAYHDSAEYREWIRMAAEFTEGAPQTAELTGLESWFTLPNAPLRAAPKWKVAAATFVGVFPTATLLSLTVGRVIRSWPMLLGGVLFNACMVAALTWLVMPFVTRLLHDWMFDTSRNPSR